MNGLINNYPDDFVGIQLHLGDAYATTWTAQRGSFYGVSGYPDAWFDGILERSGTYTDDSQAYNYYNSARSTRAAVPTDTTIELSVVRTAEQTFDVTCTIAIEAGGVGKDLKAHIPLCLDHYPSSGDDRYRNCVVDHKASALFTLAAGESYSFTKEFTLSGASWTNKEDTKFVAFVRNQGSSGPQEIHNATQLAWPFYVDGDVDRDGDVEISDLAAMLGTYGTCSGDADYVPEADFNWDQCITISDLAVLLGNYGYTP